MTRVIKSKDIFNPDPNKVAKNNEFEVDQTDVLVYTFFGNHDYVDESGHPRLIAEQENDNLAFAKTKISATGLQKYYIKSEGSGRLFNPVGLFQEGTQDKYKRGAGNVRMWEFREVNKKAFTYYVKFLTTKNTAFLSNAEREIV